MQFTKYIPSSFLLVSDPLTFLDFEYRLDSECLSDNATSGSRHKTALKRLRCSALYATSHAPPNYI